MCIYPSRHCILGKKHYFPNVSCRPRHPVRGIITKPVTQKAFGMHLLDSGTAAAQEDRVVPAHSGETDTNPMTQQRHKRRRAVQDDNMNLDKILQLQSRVRLTREAANCSSRPASACVCKTWEITVCVFYRSLKAIK